MISSCFILRLTVAIMGTICYTHSLHSEELLDEIEKSIEFEEPGKRIILNLPSKSNMNVLKDSIENTFLYIQSIQSSNTDKVNLTLSLLDLILKSHGSSIQELQEQMTSAGENPSKTLELINNVLHYNVLKRNGNIVKVNYFQLISYIRENLRATVRKLFPENYILQIIVQSEINSQINLHYLEWKSKVDKTNIPLSVFKITDPLIGSLAHRQKRSNFQTFEAFQPLLDIVFNLIKAESSGFLVIIKTSIHNVLSNITNFLLSYYTQSRPEGLIANMLDHFKNTLIQRSVELISSIELDLDKFLNKMIGFYIISVREKRDSMDDALLIRSTQKSFFSIILLPFKLIMDVVVVLLKSIINIILHPLQSISSLLSSIVSIFEWIINKGMSIIGGVLVKLLQPLNCVLKQAITKTFYQFKEFLSALLLDPIKQSLFSIIDHVIPCYNTCNLSNTSHVTIF